MLTLPVPSLPSQCDQIWSGHSWPHPSPGGEVMVALSIPVPGYDAMPFNTQAQSLLLSILGNSAKYNLGLEQSREASLQRDLG